MTQHLLCSVLPILINDPTFAMFCLPIIINDPTFSMFYLPIIINDPTFATLVLDMVLNITKYSLISTNLYIVQDLTCFIHMYNRLYV